MGCSDEGVNPIPTNRNNRGTCIGLSQIQFPLHNPLHYELNNLRSWISLKMLQMCLHYIEVTESSNACDMRNDMVNSTWEEAMENPIHLQVMC